ncbi:MAG: hypothetical protein IJT13_01500 [Bacteroidaceae bacterium]|nr:hypothetical protein [Bacteroidaceae bacterium]
MMASSKNVAFMHTFGQVHKEMMEWMIANKPTEAQEWLDKLASIKWKNYLTPKEAEKIVAGMNPKAPWSRDAWRQAMEQAGFELEMEPYYNRCALWVTMNMIMSDSSETLAKYVDNGNLFSLVHDLAVDKLTDKDMAFNIRRYFNA